MSSLPPADEALPLFPLQTVLFPGGWLPLQIFEVRYLDMIGQCHREGRPFGVVSLLQGQEVQRAGESAPEAFQPVGTLAHIVGPELPVRQPYLWHDAGWLANRWCELLGLPAARMQQLMSLESPLLRLELVADLLERDHGLTPPAPH